MSIQPKSISSAEPKSIGCRLRERASTMEVVWLAVVKHLDVHASDGREQMPHHLAAETEAAALGRPPASRRLERRVVAVCHVVLERHRRAARASQRGAARRPCGSRRRSRPGGPHLCVRDREPHRAEPTIDVISARRRVPSRPAARALPRADRGSTTPAAHNFSSGISTAFSCVAFSSDVVGFARHDRNLCSTRGRPRASRHRLRLTIRAHNRGLLYGRRSSPMHRAHDVLSVSH